MTETETSQAPAASMANASTARKTTARKRTPRKKSATAGARRTAVTAKKRTVRKAQKTVRLRKDALDKLVQGLAKKALDARGRVVNFSQEQAGAARRAAGKVAASSKKTIARVRKEWNGMDSARKATFVAALLGALAAASGSIAASRKKK